MHLPPYGLPKRSSKRSYAVPLRAAKHEVNQILKKLRDLGLKLEFASGAGHWRVIDPGTGAFLTYVSNTPSDNNWWHQVRRAVERAGYSWEGKPRKKIKISDDGSPISYVDLEALSQAQRMARLHGEREPQIDDLVEDESLRSELRRGFGPQEAEEASTSMSQGVDSERAHSVINRLQRIVQEHGTDLANRARERNPRLKDGGVVNEIVHAAQIVASKRGLRYFKTSNSATVSITGLLNGSNGGMSSWVANLLDATMDELESMNWELPENEPAPAVVPPDISLEEARDLLKGVLSHSWTPRPEIRDVLVPEQMSQRRFEAALSALYRDGVIDRQKEKRHQGGMTYKLVTETPQKKKRLTSSMSTSETESAIMDLLDDDWVPREQLADVIVSQGVTDRTFRRAVTNLLKDERIETRKIGHTSRSEMRLAPAEMVAEEHISTPQVPEQEVTEHVFTGDSIADRYANVLLKKLNEANGNTDWRTLEPILDRLDRLAGISQ